MVVPGSHKWPRDREPDPSEAVLVNIPKGAALITVASTWHGMTAVAEPTVSIPTAVAFCCRSSFATVCCSCEWQVKKQHVSAAAKILRLGYNASLLRSEENMFMSNPPEIATHYPEHIQRLVGYTVRGASYIFTTPLRRTGQRFSRKQRQTQVQIAEPSATFNTHVRLSKWPAQMDSRITTVSTGRDQKRVPR